MRADLGGRPLSRRERDQLAAARLLAADAAPYLAAALFRVSVVAADIGTFAVDRWWRLYVDPRQLDAWGPRTSAAVLVHEVHHLLRNHADRADDLSVTSATQRHSNLAADAEINDDLTGRSAQLPLPQGSVTPATIGCDDGELYEHYYHHLLRFDGRTPAPGTDEDELHDDEPQGEDCLDDDLPANPLGDCGSGAGGGPRAWEIGADAAIAPIVSGSEAQLVRWTVAHELLAQGGGRGDAPAGLTRWAEDVLGRGTIHWRSVLAASLRRAWAWRAGQVDHSYRRPSRRRIDGIVLPALMAPQPRLAVILDTSGSMGPGQLGVALSEVEGLARQVGIRRDDLQLICVDAAAAHPQRWVSADRIQLVGGGGTDLRVGFDAAALLPTRPDVLIVLTDGFTPWPSAPPRAMRTVVVLLPPGAAAATVPGWARTVVVDGGEAPSRSRGGRR